MTSTNPGPGVDEVRDRAWLVDTLSRFTLRYGNALHALSQVPAPILLARLGRLPDDNGVQEAGEALAKAVWTATNELDRCAEYVAAIIEPGPVTCGVCGARVLVFDSGEIAHFRVVPDRGTPRGDRGELFEAGHPAQPVFDRPHRPDWSAHDADLTGPSEGEDPK